MPHGRILPLAVLASAAAILAASNAWAHVSARTVRSSMDDGFWTNLFLMAVPLIVLVGLVALLHRIEEEPEETNK